MVCGQINDNLILDCCLMRLMASGIQLQNITMEEGGTHEKIMPIYALQVHIIITIIFYFTLFFFFKNKN